MSPRALFFKYVNPTHFMIGTLGVWGAHLLGASFGVLLVTSLIGWIGHELWDGDLFGYDHSNFPGIGEGIKDVLWGLLPLLGYFIR